MEYFDIFRSILRYFEKFRNIWNISKYFEIFQSISKKTAKYFEIFRNISKYFQIFRNISKYFEISLRIFPQEAPDEFGGAPPFSAPTCDFPALWRVRSGSVVVHAQKNAVLLRFWRSPWPPEPDFEASWPLWELFLEAETPVFRLVLAAFVRSVLTSSESNKTL